MHKMRKEEQDSTEHKKVSGIISENIIQRIKKFTDILKEVEPTTVEERCKALIERYSTEAEMESNILVNEKIASSFQLVILENPKFTLDQKLDVYAVLLRLTMAMYDFSTIGYLNEAQINNIVKVFSKTPIIK